MHIPLGIIFLVCLALMFDFLNGFHDSANAIATIVSTRVLTPRRAVVFAAFFEFSAFFFLACMWPIPSDGASLTSMLLTRPWSLAPLSGLADGILSPGISACLQVH